MAVHIVSSCLSCKDWYFIIFFNLFFSDILHLGVESHNLTVGVGLTGWPQRGPCCFDVP